MRKLGISVIMCITAVVTAVLTSLFWLAVYSVPANMPQTKPEEAPSEAEITAALDHNQAPVAVTPSGLAIPVAGMRSNQLTDTYSASRSGGRVHNAIDIMAPRGTPVVAAADGTVERLHFSQGGGGITIYVRSPDQNWSYYYAHLEAYAPGLHEGQQVHRGEAIGLVGSTGNAAAAGPHLHFQINRMGATDRWWQGTPINPYPLLAGRMASR